MPTTTHVSQPAPVFINEPGDMFAYGWVAGAPLVHVAESGLIAAISDRVSPRHAVDIAACGLSDDRGQTWKSCTQTPDGLYRIVDAQRPFRPIRVADGSLLDVGLQTWVEVTQQQAKTLSDQGRLVHEERSGDGGATFFVPYGVWTARSTDDGKSWDISELNPPPGIPWGNARRYGEAVKLHDGSFIKAYWGPGGGSGVIRTADSGQTWTGAAISPHFYPTLAQLPSGRILAMVQPFEQGFLFTTYSDDNGQTWTGHVQTPIRGGNPWLLTTSDHKLVALYAREDPSRYPESTGVFACVSTDGGQSWNTDREITLFDNHNQPMLTMVGGAALPDGHVLAVFHHEGRTIMSAVTFVPEL
jgi:hypothetical protein